MELVENYELYHPINWELYSFEIFFNDKDARSNIYTSNPHSINEFIRPCFIS